MYQTDASIFLINHSSNISTTKRKLFISRPKLKNLSLRKYMSVWSSTQFNLIHGTETRHGNTTCCIVGFGSYAFYYVFLKQKIQTITQESCTFASTRTQTHTLCYSKSPTEHSTPRVTCWHNTWFDMVHT